jgi:peptide deformylase
MLKIAQVGEAVLKTPAIEVTRFDEELRDFADALLATMFEARGIGIAATQVFDPRAIMIMASKPNARYPTAPEMEPMLMINPKILEQGGEPVKDWEGCLSVPGIRGLVKRHTYVKIEYQDIHGHRHVVEWQDFLARVFLHEYDHLIGKTWLDRVESVADIVGEAVYMKLMAPNQEI